MREVVDSILWIVAMVVIVLVGVGSVTLTARAMWKIVKHEWQSTKDFHRMEKAQYEARKKNMQS